MYNVSHLGLGYSVAGLAHADTRAHAGDVRIRHDSTPKLSFDTLLRRYFNKQPSPEDLTVSTDYMVGQIMEGCNRYFQRIDTIQLQRGKAVPIALKDVGLILDEAQQSPFILPHNSK